MSNCEINESIPGIEQLGFSVKVKSVLVLQVTTLLPLLACSGLEQVTSTTVPGSTGNCAVVSSVLIHSVFSPVQSSVKLRLNILSHTNKS